MQIPTRKFTECRIGLCIYKEFQPTQAWATANLSKVLCAANTAGIEHNLDFYRTHYTKELLIHTKFVLIFQIKKSTDCVTYTFNS
jgi:hypothetical protein